MAKPQSNAKNTISITNSEDPCFSRTVPNLSEEPGSSKGSASSAMPTQTKQEV